MRPILVPAIGLALMAAPAFAQSSGQSGSTQGQGSSAQSGSQMHAMSQDNLRKQLQQAGFKNVQIIDAAYLVQAQTSDGNTVFMTVNPPAMSGSSSTSSSSGGDSSSGGGQGQSGSSKQ